MNTLEAILKRKSVRAFNSKPITEQELNTLLTSAWASPIGRARYDTVALTVITNKDVIADWEALVGQDAHPFYGAPVVILISSVINPPPSDNVNYSNAAIIVENIALAATELGIGECHIWGAVRTLNTNPNFIARLNIPQGMIPCCAVALGHFDGEFELRQPVQNRIATHFIK